MMETFLIKEIDYPGLSAENRKILLFKFSNLGNLHWRVGFRQPLINCEY